jgi:hypothetical protein
MTNAVAGEVRDSEGRRVILPSALWTTKILRDLPELSGHLADVLRTVEGPDLVLPDPVFDHRRRHYLRGAGPSRWLLVVVSYEQ